MQRLRACQSSRRQAILGAGRSDRAATCHLSGSGTFVSAVLSRVKDARGIWRVRIAWPNGRVHYFGKFLTEKEAVEWIADHESLTKPIAKKHD
jgi:hypothetical protein